MNLTGMIVLLLVYGAVVSYMAAGKRKTTQRRHRPAHRATRHRYRTRPTPVADPGPTAEILDRTIPPTVDPASLEQRKFARLVSDELDGLPPWVPYGDPEFMPRSGSWHL